MPAINFKKQFSTKVLSGEKRSTIRAKRQHLIKKGDTLSLYTGLRTKETKLLKKAECKHVKDIIISYNHITIGDRKIKSKSALNRFAKKDGFDNWGDMMLFFDMQYQLPFKGVLIKW